MDTKLEFKQIYIPLFLLDSKLSSDVYYLKSYYWCSALWRKHREQVREQRHWNTALPSGGQSDVSAATQRAADSKAQNLTVEHYSQHYCAVTSVIQSVLTATASILIPWFVFSWNAADTHWLR